MRVINGAKILRQSVLMLLPLLALAIPSQAQTDYAYRIPPSRWKLDDYVTWIEFSDYLCWNKIEWSGDKLRFLAGSSMGNGSISDVWFSVQNADMIITRYFSNGQLIFTLEAPYGSTSVTKVSASDLGNATKVAVRNEGSSWKARSWQYDNMTKTITVNVWHSGTVEVLIDWLPVGDVNRDGEVDIYDLFALGKAYASNSTKPNWNPGCDFDLNGEIDALDLLEQTENYGRM